MVTHEDLSHAVVLVLAELWNAHKSGDFCEYLAGTYGVHVDIVPSFECIYIAESESGDLDTGGLGSIIKRWWMVDDTGLTTIRRPTLPATDEPFPFDRRPVLRFFTNGQRIIIGERLGPDMICRKAGRIATTGDAVLVTDIHMLLCFGRD